MQVRAKGEGSTEIWTRIAGFRVQSANHYTIEPLRVGRPVSYNVLTCLQSQQSVDVDAQLDQSLMAPLITSIWQVDTYFHIQIFITIACLCGAIG